MEGRGTKTRGSPRRGGLRRIGWALAALGLGVAVSAQGVGGVTRPPETADAVLVSENESWNRYLHDALGLPSWLDLAIEHRTRFEFLEDPFRPGEPDTQSQYPQRTRLRVGADGPGVRLVLSPHPDIKAQLKLRYWELAQARDAFVGTGLHDATGAAGRHLGVDVELRVQWRPTPWLLVDAGYDHWFKGSYLDRVSNVSSTSNSDYVYLQTRFWF